MIINVAVYSLPPAAAHAVVLEESGNPANLLLAAALAATDPTP